MATETGKELGTECGRAVGTDQAAQLVMYGGSGWDTSNRLIGALGGTFRGITAGHVIACLCRIDTQVASAKLLDYLDGSGKGWDLFQDTATSIRWRNANAAGNAWFSTAAYSPAPDLGKVQLLLLRYTGPGGVVQMWASDAQVGADVAADGYTLPATSLGQAIGFRQNGTVPHTGAVIFGWGAWSALTTGVVHDIYAAVKATGKIPTGVGGEQLVCNVGDDVSGASFPTTITDQVGSNDFTFALGSAAGIDLVTATNPTFAW